MTSPEAPPECAWALETLFESWDERAEPDKRERLRRHLTERPDCRRAQDWEARLTAALVATPFPAPAAALAAEVKVRLRRRRRQRLLAALAALALAVGVVVALLLATAGT